MKDETKKMRDAMVRFERAVVEQAQLTVKDSAREADWVWDALHFAGRLCAALRESLPADDDDDRDRPQEIIEGLVQWPEFQGIWSRSTPREKDYVRNLLRLHT